MANVGEFMIRRQEVGLTIRNKRLHTLEYADDLIILAETRKEMKEALKVMEKHLGKKN